MSGGDDEDDWESLPFEEKVDGYVRSIREGMTAGDSALGVEMTAELAQVRAEAFRRLAREFDKQAAKLSSAARKKH